MRPAETASFLGTRRKGHMNPVYARLHEEGIRFFEYGITALDAYYDEPSRPVRFVLTECSVIDLARCFDSLHFPSLPYADAALIFQADEYRFVCTEDARHFRPGGAWSEFLHDPVTGIFHDKGNIYEALRQRALPVPDSAACSLEQRFFEAAVLASLHPDGASLAREHIHLPPSIPVQFQKDLLVTILAGPQPAAGLEFLYRTGFIAREWPEIAQLDEVDHSKDCHPEGNGWAHTLETFTYRKDRALVLSLALLLHDIGKPEAAQKEGRRFDRHAEIGALRARRFLVRLGFSLSIQNDVQFLVRYHMFPAALGSLPVQIAEPLVKDPRFPTLLELFRCDEFSSFKDPERYYESCNAYRTLMKHMRNPYRTADGRRVGTSRRAAHF